MLVKGALYVKKAQNLIKRKPQIYFYILKKSFYITEPFKTGR